MSHLTRQEAFDRMVAHARTMPQPAMGEPGASCLYRVGMVPEGLPCLIGALIPNDRYTTTMEGQPADEVLVAADVIDPADCDNGGYEFWGMCQGAHDDNSSSPSWRERMLAYLARVAKDWDLTMPQEPAS